MNYLYAYVYEYLYICQYVLGDTTLQDGFFSYFCVVLTPEWVFNCSWHIQIRWMTCIMKARSSAVHGWGDEGIFQMKGIAAASRFRDFPASLGS